jgi:DNA-binding CsgD family transcriptional regulator
MTKKKIMTGNGSVGTALMLDELTRKEMIILNLLEKGCGHLEISKRCSIDIDGIFSHIDSIYKKFVSQSDSAIASEFLYNVVLKLIGIQKNHKAWNGLPNNLGSIILYQ